MYVCIYWVGVYLCTLHHKLLLLYPRFSCGNQTALDGNGKVHPGTCRLLNFHILLHWSESTHRKVHKSVNYHKGDISMQLPNLQGFWRGRVGLNPRSNSQNAIRLMQHQMYLALKNDADQGLTAASSQRLQVLRCNFWWPKSPHMVAFWLQIWWKSDTNGSYQHRKATKPGTFNLNTLLCIPILLPLNCELYSEQF